MKGRERHPSFRWLDEWLAEHYGVDGVSVDEAASKFSKTGPSGPSKKKEATKVEIVDNLNSAGPARQRPGNPPAEPSGPETNLELFALKMLKGDPFVTIAEIKRGFAAQAEDIRVGWWGVFRVLKRHRLLRRRSRFRYAWGRA